MFVRAALCSLSLLALGNVGEAQLRDKASLEITVATSSVAVGEPVGIRLSIRNDSSEVLRGDLNPHPLSPKVELSLRRPDGTTKRIPPIGEWDSVMERSLELKAGSTIAESAALFADSAGELVFDKPGRYELEAIYHELPNRLGASLKSNPIAIEVVPATDEATLALVASRELILLTQYRPGKTFVSTEGLLEAERFIQRFPSSAHGMAVRAGVRGALRYKEQRKLLSPTEERLLERLQAKFGNDDEESR